MRYTVETASDGMTYTQKFIKVGYVIQAMLVLRQLEKSKFWPIQ
jgi:hypothetical protein